MILQPAERIQSPLRRKGFSMKFLMNMIMLMIMIMMMMMLMLMLMMMMIWIMNGV
jgi:hypothetical protein